MPDPSEPVHDYEIPASAEDAKAEAAEDGRRRYEDERAAFAAEAAPLAKSPEPAGPAPSAEEIANAAKVAADLQANAPSEVADHQLAMGAVAYSVSLEGQKTLTVGGPEDPAFGFAVARAKYLAYLGITSPAMPTVSRIAE